MVLIVNPKFHNYIIMPDGEIYNATTGAQKSTFLNQGRCKTYERVQLMIQGKKQNFYVHRLVAMAYMPEFHPAMEVNHIDGNTLNNDISNLEVLSHSDNVKHSYWLRERTYKGVKLGILTVNAMTGKGHEI